MCQRSCTFVLMLVLGATVLLGGCRDVPRPDFQPELTAERSAHEVELWYRPEDRSLKYAYGFTLRLPKAAFMFRQNHEERRQAAIGLLLDKVTLQPLTLRIAEETGARDSRSLKKALEDRYRDRALLVDLSGLSAGSPGRPAADNPLFKPLRTQDGFQLYEDSRAGAYPQADDRPPLTGWSLSDPPVRMDCPAQSPVCGLYASYKDARMHFTLPRSEVAQAEAVRARLVRFLAASTRS